MLRLRVESRATSCTARCPASCFCGQLFLSQLLLSNCFCAAVVGPAAEPTLQLSSSRRFILVCLFFFAAARERVLEKNDVARKDYFHPPLPDLKLPLEWLVVRAAVSCTVSRGSSTASFTHLCFKHSTCAADRLGSFTKVENRSEMI